jgi:hypothetical protein
MQYVFVGIFNDIKKRRHLGLNNILKIAKIDNNILTLDRVRRQPPEYLRCFIVT